MQEIESSDDEYNKLPAEADAPDDPPIEADEPDKPDKPAEPALSSDDIGGPARFDDIGPLERVPAERALAGPSINIDDLRYAEAQRYPLLERDDERLLAQRWREHGDRAARDRLVASHLRLVEKIARDRKRGCPKHIRLDELVAEGRVGLVNAAEKFDPSRGYRFSSYAKTAITNAINLCIQRSSSIVKVGGADPNPWWHGRDESLNASIRYGEDGEEQDRLVDETSDPETRLAAAETLGDYDEAAEALLDKRERRIFKARRLTDEPISREELAREFGVTPEYVRQIEAAAFEKLQKALSSGAFKSTRAARLFGGNANPPKVAAKPAQGRLVDGVTPEWHKRLKHCEGWPAWRDGRWLEDYSIALRSPSQGRDRQRAKELKRQAARGAASHIIDIAGTRYDVPIAQARVARRADWPGPARTVKIKYRRVWLTPLAGHPDYLMVRVRRQQDVPAPKGAGGPVFDNTRSGTRIKSDPLPKLLTTLLVARRKEAAARQARQREADELVAVFVKRGGTVTRVPAFLKSDGTVVAPEGEYVPHPCFDCGVDVHKICESYMVHDELWDRAHKHAPRRAKGYLCIGCLEDRIGRKLTPVDFTDALCNSPKRAGNVMSLRLRARVGAPPWWHAIFSKAIDFESLPVELRLLALGLPLPHPPAEFALAAE
jgi:RNA polymerase sigma-32 factor